MARSWSPCASRMPPSVHQAPANPDTPPQTSTYLKPEHIERRMRPEDILKPTPAGLYCEPGGFHIDPTRPVDNAVIQHGHSETAPPPASIATPAPSISIRPGRSTKP